MNSFGGSAFFIDRDDINTDEIIPAKYLTEISKTALKDHLLEDLLIDGKKFDHQAPALTSASVIISKKNFGCGSSREHAVWAFEVNDIKVIIAESFARIFRQNMFNCGILAIEMNSADIDKLFTLKDDSVKVTIDFENDLLQVTSGSEGVDQQSFPFSLNDFDKELVAAGGWLEYAESRY